ncbi:MAG TPA: acyltransferase family protein [Gemmataceae bacterium]|nr:acyltransferase family protein [Gemmataceae bacterium]
MQKEQRIRGLDTIRFLLAVIVVVYHTNSFPLLTGIDEGSAVGHLVKKWYQTCINGQAAVIAFFVISGFCIHYPFRKTAPRLLSYFPRRLFRTVTPVAALLVLARVCRVSMPVLGPSVLWSLICEEVYYFLYPFVTRPLQRKVGWGVLVLVSFVASECLSWAWPKPLSQGGYVVYGWQLNWFLALPCWLLGCMIAEGADALTAPVSRPQIWAWRVGVFILSGVCEHYRLKLAMTHSLNYFAFVVFAWLQQEVRYNRHVSPSGVLEWAGKWSYSLYLTHLVSYAVYDRWYHLPFMGLIPSWFMHMGWVLGWAYGFYLLVEKPSHMLARWLGARLGKPQAGSGTILPGPAPLRAAG